MITNDKLHNVKFSISGRLTHFNTCLSVNQRVTITTVGTFINSWRLYQFEANILSLISSLRQFHFTSSQRFICKSFTDVMHLLFFENSLNTKSNSWKINLNRSKKVEKKTLELLKLWIILLNVPAAKPNRGTSERLKLKTPSKWRLPKLPCLLLFCYTRINSMVNM